MDDERQSTIEDALKAGCRLDNGSRWMVWGGTSPSTGATTWRVYERQYGAERTRVVVSTEDEGEAVRRLLRLPD